MRSLNDEVFTEGYSKKLGASKASFTPVVNYKSQLDSHSTLSRTDQRRVNAILDRRVAMYGEIAKEQLAELLENRSQKQKHSLHLNSEGKLASVGGSIDTTGDFLYSIQSAPNDDLPQQAGQPKTAQQARRFRA